MMICTLNNVAYSDPNRRAGPGMELYSTTLADIFYFLLPFDLKKTTHI